jgi:hypothetical protein
MSSEEEASKPRRSGSTLTTGLFTETSPQQGTITLNAPYQLKLNSWTREQWLGGPPEPIVVATCVIDWIRFTRLERQ